MNDTMDAQVKRRNLCNCPNCQTDDCPAGVELAALKRELTSMTLDRNERAKQKSDFFVAAAKNAMNMPTQEAMTAAEACAVEQPMTLTEAARIIDRESRLPQLLALAAIVRVYLRGECSTALLLRQSQALDAARKEV